VAARLNTVTKPSGSCLTVKEVFPPTHRGVEGFVRSLFRMLKINLPVPDHATLFKRAKDLKVNLQKKPSQSPNIVTQSLTAGPVGMAQI